MTGVISHYNTQLLLDRQKPPFSIPQNIRDKARVIQESAKDGVCEHCRAVFQFAFEKLRDNEDLDSLRHHDNIVQLTLSAARQCALCIFFLKVVLEEPVPDPPPRGFKENPLMISFTKETMDQLVSPLAGCVVRFSYSGPTNALSNRYFQIDLGDNWTNRFPGRPISARAPLGLVPLWLRQCASAHADCPRIKDRGLPTRFIDVEPSIASPTPRLVSRDEENAPQTGRYLVLSHCWGSLKPAVVTLTSNLDQYRVAIPYPRLSRNFQDAITIARELGFRYLWIDSLCIVQDSVQDWQRECTKMESVYANATMTIAAIGAADSQAGLLNPRPVQTSCTLTLQHHDGDSVALRVSRLSNGQAVVHDQRDAVLFTRAWALQERLLSQRVLYFGTEQLYFECCTSQFFESCYFPIKTQTSGRENWLSNVDKVVDSKTGKLLGKAPTAQDFYFKLGPYAFCFLTKASDRLPAAGGLARRYASLTGDQYVAGIWRSDLLLGLLWTAGWHDADPDRLQIARYSHDAEAKKCLPPSWSWASCELPTAFRHSTNTGSLIDIIRCDASLVSDDPYGQVNGGVLEVRGWTVDCVADEIDYKPWWWGEDLRADVCGQKELLFARLFRDRPRGMPLPFEDPVIAQPADSSEATFTDLDLTQLTKTLEEMGFNKEKSERALVAAGGDLELAISYVLTNIPEESDSREDRPALPPRPSASTSSDRTPDSLTCLVLSRSFPVSWTPGWDWCGLALIPADGHPPNTYRRIGFVYSSRIHGGRYEKIAVNPEESVGSITQGSKRTLRII